MSRQKKSRRVTDIMPTRKADRKPDGKVPVRAGRKPTRYELDAKAREEKRKRKHKGLASGSRHSATEKKAENLNAAVRDPRIGSRKKVPLTAESVNKPEKGPFILPGQGAERPQKRDPMLELEQLENNECLSQLLDKLDAGNTLSVKDQKFADECLKRIAELMDELGIEEESENDLYRTFERIDINQFK